MGGVGKIEDKGEGIGRGEGRGGRGTYVNPVVSRSCVCVYELSFRRVSSGISAGFISVC